MKEGYIIRGQSKAHFITATVVDWIDVFARKRYCDIVIDCLNFCIKNKGMILYGYVVMSNHIHMIVQSENGKLSEYSSWGRYDLDGQENAMYLSKTATGNKTELVPHYGDWLDYSTYNFQNVKVENLLDLTDDAIRKQLGTEFEQLTKVVDIPKGATPDEVFLKKFEMYEFTNELASWARKKGFNGLIVKGARGAKNYDNVVLFDQKYIDDILSGITPTKINK